MKKLITEYLINSYQFSVNHDNWCVLDKSSKKRLILHGLIRDMNKVFPNMGVEEICTEWWNENLKTNTEKITNFLSGYKLVQTNKGLVWALRKGNKEFNLDDLVDMLPDHFNYHGIKKLFENWYEEEKIKATEKEMFG